MFWGIIVKRHIHLLRSKMKVYFIFKEILIKCELKWYTCFSRAKMKVRVQENFVYPGMGILRIFFFQCFQSSAFLRISAVSSFNQRERERQRNAVKMLTKITLTEP